MSASTPGWAALPRFPLAVLPTPLVRAHRLEAALGCGPLLVKRDDLIGFGVAGNKARPLEYLMGAAREQGAEVFVTGGGPGSNFCAAAAQAARVAGLECELMVWGDPAGAPNLALAAAAGARLVPTGGEVREAVDEMVAARAEELAASGRRAFAVPRGGSTGLGAVGFAAAAAELAAQLTDLNPAARPALIVFPIGSGGSSAGLLAGLAAVGLDIPVLGVSVSRPPAEIGPRVHELARACAQLLGTPVPRPEQLELLDARGPGFGVASQIERERARLVLHTEGLLLDETYGAEALSAAVDRLLGDPPGPVLWWHTGGLIPAVSTIMKGTR
ncbi:1-aminocyclopropane-1-carboxylate deaminase/D-cysteine desulfhydrase [Pseudonocardia bannensis]|uniref:Pyridoxal-phosphate dependent enzyme n=1 Tax=Pseudonocardia bannensis TaxID=630973 RepID=A0A848DNL0_9PSEU|nr:pyridoxal-phosphate dependent enzyme [Pseudonocardia bannensis]NMH93944.1 pyridoxal-phosphate dependent enzyme [Pseudonocardia bannensis]